MNTMNNNQQANQNQAKMSEKEFLEDLLTQEKHILNLYTTAIMEASCPQLRELLLSNLKALSNDQFMIFEQMSKRGYYPTKVAPPQEIQQAKQAVSQLAH